MIIAAVVTGWVTGRVRWRWVVLVGAAHASHFLLDWLGAGPLPPAGLQLLWPFSQHVLHFRLGCVSADRTASLLSRRHLDQCSGVAGGTGDHGTDRVVQRWSGLGVDVEAAPRLPPKIAGRDHPPEQRTRAILRVAEPFVQHVENREADVEADEIGQRQRSHRMIHAALHHRVDRFGRADSFHHCVERLVQHRQQDPVGDEAGIVGRFDAGLPERAHSAVAVAIDASDVA